MSDDTDDKPLNRYEQKVADKRERYAELADKARRESGARYQAARATLDVIPMGQPILVGHHSEKRHRRDLERVDNNMRKSFEASDKAAHYDHKAKTAGTAGISSDDPDAVVKLKQELAALTESRGVEKLWNRALKVEAKAREKRLGRKLSQLDHIEIVLALPMPDAFKKAMLSYARAFPWLPQFGNHTQANISRIGKRIAELESKAAAPEREPLRGEVDGTSYTIEWNKHDNRVQIYFPFRPSDAVCDKLRARGFKWARSVGAWQRHASEGAWYHARQICGATEPTREVTATTRHCDGCDADHDDVADYVVTHHDDTTSNAAYCGDCAGLARADWNGETKSIAPRTERCPHGALPEWCAKCEVDRG